MSERLNRLAPLSGIIFFILLVVAIFTSGSSPSAGSSGAKVIAFYTQHRSSQRVSDILFVLAAAFLSCSRGCSATACATRPTARRRPRWSARGFWPPASQSSRAWTMHSRAHPAQLTASTAQVLNTVSNDAFFTAVMGGLVFGVCAGIAVLRASVLPRWLGVLGLIFGIAAATPASFAGLAGMALWSLVVAVVLYARAERPKETSSAPIPAAAH